MNITPVSAAMGICSIAGAANKIKNSKNKAAIIPAIRVLPPDSTFIIDWPIIAHPPIPPKNPVARLAHPCATHSLDAPPRWPVISPTRFKVNRLSIKPIDASITAYGNIINKVSKFTGTIGSLNSGNPPDKLAMSPTRSTFKSRINTKIVTIEIAKRGAGTNFVIRGVTHIKAIVAHTKPIVM